MEKRRREIIRRKKKKKKKKKKRKKREKRKKEKRKEKIFKKELKRNPLKNFMKIHHSLISSKNTSNTLFKILQRISKIIHIIKMHSQIKINFAKFRIDILSRFVMYKCFIVFSFQLVNLFVFF